MKHILIVFLLFMVLLAFGNSATAYPISDGLVSYWQFNDGGTDKTGRGHTGQVHGDASYEFVDDNFERALHLGGDSGYFSVPDHADFDFFTQFTAILWINPVDKNEDVTLIGKWKYMGGSERAYMVNISSADNVSTILNYDGGSADGYTSNIKVSFGQWQQIAIVYNGSSVTVYKNAVPGIAQSTSSPLANNPNNLLLGAYNWFDLDAVYPNGYFYEGWIDEVKFFERALTGTEITQDFQYVTNGIPDDPQQVIPEPLSFVLMISGLSVLMRKRLCAD